MNKCKNCGANSFLNNTCLYCGSSKTEEVKKVQSLKEIKGNNNTLLDGKNCIMIGKNNTSLI